MWAAQQPFSKASSVRKEPAPHVRGVSESLKEMLWQHWAPVGPCQHSWMERRRRPLRWACTPWACHVAAGTAHLVWVFTHTVEFLEGLCWWTRWDGDPWKCQWKQLHQNAYIIVKFSSIGKCFCPRCSVMGSQGPRGQRWIQGWIASPFRVPPECTKHY